MYSSAERLKNKQKRLLKKQTKETKKYNYNSRIDIVAEGGGEATNLFIFTELYSLVI